MIEFQNLYKRLAGKQVLDGVNLSVVRGQVTFIIGSSGVGKSVLTKHLIGLMRPDAGRILLDGEDISGLSERAFYGVRRKMGMVFQHSTLFDSMTLQENVELPLRKHFGLDGEELEGEARRYLSLVRMEEHAGRYPPEIGAGMQKRVAIARTLAMRPAYILYDEPTTGLDPVSARRVDRLIRRMADQTGVTSIVVSHDLESIFSVADRIAMLYKGKVRLMGTPEDFRRSSDAVVQQFIQGRAVGPMEL